MIEIIRFGKAYDSEVAVEELSFRVAGGQILGLIGPNGAGKTTTMRAIAGIIPPSHGRCRVAGFDVTEHPVDVKRRVAYVPDDPRLFDDLTVVEHFAFFAAAYRVPHWQDRMVQLLNQFDLTKKQNALARNLSRGMRQKLAIGCAWLYRPSALLLDEPMTGLDPQGIRTLKQSIRELANDGSAVVISSHLLAMVEDICSHVLILADGRQRFYGTIQDLRQTFAAENDVATTLEDMFFRAVRAEPLPVVDSISPMVDSSLANR